MGRETIPSPDDLLLLPEVAEITRAPLSTVRYWRHIGFGPESFHLGRRVVYRACDVKSWLEQQRGADVYNRAV